MTSQPGVSFVVPVHNGRRWLSAVIGAIQAQRDGRPFEVIVVDDGSVDGSARWLREQAATGALTVVPGPRCGAAAAVNAGIREAANPIICQIDQDVILQPGWLSAVLAALEDPDVAAAQGRYVTAEDAGFWARVMGRDLELRYARLRGSAPGARRSEVFTDHVCTGNTAYRASALHGVGLLDDRFGYGYDNDLSYRLVAAGYRLAFCHDAVSVHRWREDAAGYLRQQFGVGYGRLDVIRKHPARLRGDRVSTAVMMAHAPLALLALTLLATSALLTIAGFRLSALDAIGVTIAAGLALERAIAAAAAWRQTGDRVSFAFPAVHLLRDLAWALAIAIWLGRRVAGAMSVPDHSMRRYPVAAASRAWVDLSAHQLLAVIPAYNEADNLARVVRELRRVAPAIDILVVNDGSTDDTADLLPTLGVDWLSIPERVGVGGAVRAGLRYALRRGYEFVVRIDGDGQHRPGDIRRLLQPVASNAVDAIIGSRFLARRRRWPTLLRSAQAVLAVCLTALTRQRITDPTSGFYLFGPRAVRLLGRHHPTGYAEPELLLLMSRNGLRFGEVPIRTRPRLAGRTSLTPARASMALGRTLLALLVVPVRRVVDWNEPW